MDDAPHGNWPQTLQNALLQGAGAAFVATFCYWTASLVPFLPDAFWAPIAAVVVLYPGREATTRASAARFFGTAIGSLVGWGSAVWWHHNLLLFGLAVLIAVGLGYLLRLANAAHLCAVAVIVITLVPQREPAHLVAFYRFVEVSYGVACAWGYTMAVAFIHRRRARRA